MSPSRKTPPPREEELRTLAETIHRRLLGLMKRRGMLRADDTSNEEKQLDALAACGQLALTPGKRKRSGPALSRWWTRMSGAPALWHFCEPQRCERVRLFAGGRRGP